MSTTVGKLFAKSMFVAGVAATGFVAYKAYEHTRNIQSLDPDYHPDEWTIANIPDLRGKVAVVTGANSGLGYETSRALAAKGATVVMACRNMEKGTDAADAIRAEYPEADVALMKLDLGDLVAVSNFVADFEAKYDRLDMLINNAGIMAIPLRTTVDGFETQFGVNHLGHFALTGQLFDVLKKTPQARIVNVSSGAHRMGQMDFDNLNAEASYQRWSAYGQSKLANLLFTLELQKRLDAAGLDTIAVAAHPGWAATNLQSAGPRMDNASWMESLTGIGNRILAQDQRMGALPQLYAATAPDVGGGEYFGPNGTGEMVGYPIRVPTSDAARNHEDAARLWTVSEELTSVRFDFDA